jgi:hypothetical protein
MMDTLEGAQAGAATPQLVNVMDIFARRSKLGVFIPFLPDHFPMLIQSFRSSIEIKRMFGFWVPGFLAVWALTVIMPHKSKRNTDLVFMVNAFS